MIGQAILWVFAFVLWTIASTTWVEAHRLRVIAVGLAFAGLAHVIAVGTPLLGFH
jgi:hypothetical protein